MRSLGILTFCSVSLERMDELFGTVDYSEVEDLGMAAHKGDVEKPAGVHVEQTKS